MAINEEPRWPCLICDLKGIKTLLTEREAREHFAKEHPTRGEPKLEVQFTEGEKHGG